MEERKTSAEAATGKCVIVVASPVFSLSTNLLRERKVSCVFLTQHLLFVPDIKAF